MPIIVYVSLFAFWLAWFSAFLSRKPARGGQHINKQARWGILLQMIAFTLLWQGRFWERSPGKILIPAFLLLLLAISLSWTGVTALGAHWRIDAGLSLDHQLVRSGPYLLIRHPIYTSMLCLLLGTGLIVTPWLLLLLAISIFILGTEIRTRVEDRMLAARFGEEFNFYKKTVHAYIPWLR